MIGLLIAELSQSLDELFSFKSLASLDRDDLLQQFIPRRQMSDQTVWRTKDDLQLAVRNDLVQRIQ